MGDGDGGGDAVDGVGVGFVELLEKLPRVGGEALDVSPLAFGVECVEGHARLPAAGNAAEDDQLVPRQVEIDVLQIVCSCTADSNGLETRCIGGAL